MTEKTSTSPQAPAPPPPGRYRLESDRSTIRASARAMFGLFTVKGTFRIRDGEVCIAEDPAALRPPRPPGAPRPPPPPPPPPTRTPPPAQTTTAGSWTDQSAHTAPPT